MSISFPQIYLYSEKDPVVPSVRLGGINVLQAQGTYTKLSMSLWNFVFRLKCKDLRHQEEKTAYLKRVKYP